ncbi:hypothetical protein [Rubinisphaera margarita]|uniref:hypothetical protein n=1 Tax=Rubinisphaera margarita TaxID=2909586 RepID=UPI001EE913E1|nr:hypothetical protein [Rubinisphaera margarita]MCG6155888.1 hypothetical protein [Rubinisphaera margarita]
MARGRRGNELGISLFAFQDIIMSVTGILILIVLLLVLELVNQKSTSQLQQTFETLKMELDTEMESLSTQLERIEQDLSHDSEAIDRAIRNPESVLNDQLSSERTRLNSLDAQIHTLEQVGEQLTEQQEGQSEARKILDEREREVALLRQQQAAIERQMNQLASGNSAKYLVPRGINPAQAWLCDVHGQGLHLTPMNSPEPTIEISVDDWVSESEATFSGFRQRLAEITPRVRYVLFIIRPAGREFNEPLLTKGDQLDIEFGVEYVAEEHVILR